MAHEDICEGAKSAIAFLFKYYSIHFFQILLRSFACNCGGREIAKKKQTKKIISNIIAFETNRKKLNSFENKMNVFDEHTDETKQEKGK